MAPRPNRGLKFIKRYLQFILIVAGFVIVRKPHQMRGIGPGDAAYTGFRVIEAIVAIGIMIYILFLLIDLMKAHSNSISQE